MICARSMCGAEFKANRRHQRYCSKRCRQKAYDERVPLKRVRRRERMGAGGRKCVVRRLLKARDMESAQRQRPMPIEAESRFTHQAAPGNIKGLLARVAMTSPRVMLRLSAAIREDKAGGTGSQPVERATGKSACATERPSCIGCGFMCEDGESCKILDF